MRRVCLLAMGTLLALHEQTAAAQQPGERIRLTIESAGSPRLVGAFVGRDVDSLWVELPGHVAPMALARIATAHLEVSRGQRRETVRGAEIGASLGAIGGFVLSGVAASESRPCGSSLLVDVCLTDWYGRAFRGSLIGAVVGAVVGAALGSAVKTERWVGVPSDRVPHLSLGHRSAGLAISLSL